MMQMLAPGDRGETTLRPVVLVSMDWLRPGDPPFGLGVASIASALRGAGATVYIVSDTVNRSGFSQDDFFADVSEAAGYAGPDALIGVAAFVWCELEVRELLKVLGPRTDTVLGGPQISYAGPDQLENLYPGVKYFVRGHGEAAMVALAAGRTENGRLGLHVAGTRDQFNHADFPLDWLPSPHLDGTTPVGRFVRWETQRGCPFSCSFCQHREAGARLSRTRIEAGRLHREMAAFRDAGTGRVTVLDPIFNTDTNNAIGLLNEFRCTCPDARLSLQCRFEMVDDVLLDMIGQVDAVPEFGLQTVHEDEARAIGRPNQIQKVEKVMAGLNARRIPYEVSLIYGLPLQTPDRFQASIDWLRARGAPRIRAWPLMLLRGTDLHYQRDRWGYVESDDRIPIVVESSSFSRDDHAEMERIAEGL